MKIWFDTEFIEDGHIIGLLSIGAVREDGREFYAEIAETDRDQANDWVKANVLPRLTGPVMPRAEAATKLVEFAGDEPEFWAYFCSYDWVALCQMYGTMMDLPAGWPMFCRDLKQSAMEQGVPNLQEAVPQQDEHNALADARWTREAWRHLHR